MVLVILGSAVAGAFILFILSTMKQVKMAWKIRDIEGKVRKLETELVNTKEEKEEKENKLRLLEEEIEQLKKAIEEEKMKRKELAAGQNDIDS